MSAEQDEATRTQSVRAGLNAVKVPRVHIASYVRSVVADLEPKSDAMFDQHA